MYQQQWYCSINSMYLLLLQGILPTGRQKVFKEGNLSLHKSITEWLKTVYVQVVRDPETSVDAVTMDAIARDSYLLNIPSIFDHRSASSSIPISYYYSHRRLVKFVRLNKHPESKGYVLCYREIVCPFLVSVYCGFLLF